MTAEAPPAVPARTLALVDARRRRYARQREREEATLRGQTSLDMVVRMPASAADAGAAIDQLMRQVRGGPASPWPRELS